MSTIFYYILAVLSIIPLSLHIFGLVLLWKARRAYSNRSQFLFLVNLSLSELVFVILGLLMFVCSILAHEKISFVFLVLQYIGATLVYFFVMIFMTLDRFFEVYFNIKYPLYWNSKSCQRLMLASWVTFFLLAITALVHPDFDKTLLYHWCYKYIFPSVELAFILIAIFVYSYVFAKIRWKYPTSLTNSHTSHPTSLINRNRHISQRHQNSSRQMNGFYLPTLVIITFILFAILPDFIQFYAHVTHRELSDDMECVIYLMYLLAMTTDALIYVMLSPPLRRMLRRKMKHRRSMRTLRKSTVRYPSIANDTTASLRLSVIEQNESQLLRAE